jgi:hypothetical protein
MRRGAVGHRYREINQMTAALSESVLRECRYEL